MDDWVKNAERMEQRMRDNGFTIIEDSEDSPPLVSSDCKVAFKNDVSEYALWGFMLSFYSPTVGEWVTVCLTTEGAIQLNKAMLDSLLRKVV